MKILKQVSTLQIALFLCFAILYVSSKVTGVSVGINKTDSLPQRIFLVLSKSDNLERDSYVAFKTTNKWYDAIFAKQIKGIGGDQIVIKGAELWIYNQNYSEFLGLIKSHALDGTILTPIKEGVIPSDSFLMIASHKDSLDSRYEEIGLIKRGDIEAKLIPIEGIRVLYFLIGITLYILLIRKLSNRIKARYLSIILVFVILLLPNYLLAKDLGVHGQLFEIEEVDLIEEIKGKLEVMEASGELAKLEKEWQQKAKDSAERPKPVSGFKIADENRVFFHDPSISVQYDIKDHIGNIVVAKGTRVNPLHHQSFKQDLIFIDADIQSQLDWALEENRNTNAMIILVKGSILQIMRDYKVRIYFDQNGFLLKSFNIEAVPARVSQEGDLLKIEELVI
jgi:conjugal transfer pilus assembly protein TraW